MASSWRPIPRCEGRHGPVGAGEVVLADLPERDASALERRHRVAAGRRAGLRPGAPERSEARRGRDRPWPRRPPRPICTWCGMRRVGQREPQVEVAAEHAESVHPAATRVAERDRLGDVPDADGGQARHRHLGVLLGRGVLLEVGEHRREIPVLGVGLVEERRQAVVEQRPEPERPLRK